MKNFTEYLAMKNIKGLKNVAEAALNIMQGDSLNEGVGKYSIKKTGTTKRAVNDPDAFANDVKYVDYDIVLDGKIVGTLNHEDYFDSLGGELHGKQLPPLDNYSGKGSGPLGKLHNFLKSKTGKKWLAKL